MSEFSFSIKLSLKFQFYRRDYFEQGRCHVARTLRADVGNPRIDGSGPRF